MNSPRLFLSVIAIAFFPMLCLADEARVWKSANGKFTVNATLLSISGPNVELKRADNGKVVSVPIKMLSTADHEFLLSGGAKSNPAPSPPDEVDVGSKSDAMPDATSPDADTPAPKMPGRDEIGIEAVNDTVYRLIPFGTIEVPADGMLWRIASPEPPVFVAQKPNDPQALVLTVMPRAATQPERVTTLKATYNTMVEQLQKAKLADLKGSKIDLDNDIPDKVVYGFQGKAPDSGERHFIVEVQFREKYTFLFQATSTNGANANFIIDDTKTFVPAGSKPKADIPDQVRAEITKTVTRMQAQILSGDVESLLKDVMPQEDYARLQANKENWTRLVENFKKNKGPKLNQALDQLDWSKAEYDAKENSVTFPVAPRSVVFKKAGEQWRLDN